MVSAAAASIVAQRMTETSYNKQKMVQCSLPADVCHTDSSCVQGIASSLHTTGEIDSLSSCCHREACASANMLDTHRFYWVYCLVSMQGSVMSAICMCQAQGAIKFSWEFGGDGSWP